MQCSKCVSEKMPYAVAAVDYTHQPYWSSSSLLCVGSLCDCGCILHGAATKRSPTHHSNQLPYHPCLFFYYGVISIMDLFLHLLASLLLSVITLKIIRTYVFNYPLPYLCSYVWKLWRKTNIFLCLYLLFIASISSLFFLYACYKLLIGFLHCK